MTWVIIDHERAVLHERVHIIEKYDGKHVEIGPLKPVSWKRPRKKYVRVRGHLLVRRKR